tara:strand:- start:685 stop:1668 length:984 start_codon:yes stop_codon:yes gene_type:complete
MAINYSAWDKVKAKIDARKAELNRGVTDPWQKLANSIKASKEFRKEGDAAKKTMYQTSPGGTYKSFIANRDPFRGGYQNSQGRYLQLKHQGNTHDQILRAGYTGTTPVAYTGPGSGPAKSGIASTYVAPQHRTRDEWKRLDPAGYEDRYGEVDRLREQLAALQAVVDDYKDKFDKDVEEGGGIVVPKPEVVDPEPDTPVVDPTPEVVDPEPDTPGPSSDDYGPAPEEGAGVGVQLPNNVGSLTSSRAFGSRSQAAAAPDPVSAQPVAAATDPTSVAPAPGDADAGGLVVPIKVQAEAQDKRAMAKGRSAGYLTKGTDYRKYYNSRFR